MVTYQYIDGERERERESSISKCHATRSERFVVFLTCPLAETIILEVRNREKAKERERERQRQRGRHSGTRAFQDGGR